MALNTKQRLERLELRRDIVVNLLGRLNVRIIRQTINRNCSIRELEVLNEKIKNLESNKGN